MNLFIPEIALRVGVYTNCNEAFDKIDISLLNLKFVQVKSKEFKSFFREISAVDEEYDLNTYDIIKSSKHTISPFMWVAIPIDINKIVDEDVFRQLEHSILLMFPIHFRLVSILNYQTVLEEGKYLVILNEEVSVMPSINFATRFNNVEIGRINKFLKDYFAIISSKECLMLPLQYYVAGIQKPRSKNEIH